MVVSPLTIRRLKNFRANKRGFYSTLIFSFLFLISIFAEFIANDKPILVFFNGQIHLPVFEKIPETYYGGEFETEADYKDPFVKDLINEKGFSVMPLIEYSYDTINYDLKVPSPSPPSFENLLGTDDQGRVTFKFKAPDNLTSFRVTAVGQTKDHKFGKGKAHFEVSKGLMIEPALPRFIRNGDEIVLRAILRQKVMDNAKVLINCKSGEGITNLEKEQYESSKERLNEIETLVEKTRALRKKPMRKIFLNS